MKDTGQLLFDYLKDILYHPDRANLDLEVLPPEFRKLGEGMAFLADCVREERAFAKAMAKGDLSVKPPSGNNVLAAPIKELQGSLRHLAWQTQRVAKGDYSQRVDFMGEFSSAFNTMTEQLKERTARLVEEKEKVQRKNQELEHSMELVFALTNHTHNMIYVFSVKDGQLIFTNQAAKWFLKVYTVAASALQSILLDRGMKGDQESEFWEARLAPQEEMGERYYEVESFPIPWSGEQAVVHIVADSTERKKRENIIYHLAYTDPLTNSNNRRYAMDLMERWVREGTPFLLSFVDVDDLKYCNDTYGHAYGDEYLIEVANALKTLGTELCRVGGDEFFLLQKGTDARAQDERLLRLRKILEAEETASYPMSFSFATTAVPPYPEKPLESYIMETDQKMYRYKTENKKKKG